MLFTLRFGLVFLLMSANAWALTPAQQVGQKTLLDLRYFCVTSPESGPCRTPFTDINDANRKAITRLLTHHAVGGVILFSENITGTEQLVRLTYSLQQIMQRANLPPLFIATDQEGGRVARLPDNMAVRFAGNMAIGATFKRHGVRFARDVAGGMAGTLALTGINTNFAPSLDVNTNPDNPVINVRSFGESPEMVARLGEASVRAIQSKGVVAAVKHFPGHGDTHVDSHTGLPRVEHALPYLLQNELLPFRKVINAASPAMVMTAHIQFPGLDNTLITTKSGEQIMVPATMSRRVLQDILRKQFQFDGLIVSDAMDMAGISQFLTPQQALTAAFIAGVDIALMPYKISTPNDIAAFSTLLAQVAETLVETAETRDQLAVSLQRIRRIKREFGVGKFIDQPLSARLTKARSLLPQPSNRELEAVLSREAATLIKPSSVLPLKKNQRWLALMPDTARCEQFKSTATSLGLSQSDCLSYYQLPAPSLWQSKLKNADYVIAGDISPQHAYYETGGRDPVRPRAALSDQLNWLTARLAEAKAAQKPTVIVAMRAPYQAISMAAQADSVLALYDYHVDDVSHEPVSPDNRVMITLIKVLSGEYPANGTLPVSLRQPLLP